MMEYVTIAERFGEEDTCIYDTIGGHLAHRS
jgi:hypothetical protein